MANPNILNVTSILGVTTSVNLSTTNVTTFLSNGVGSNEVLKINTIIASNTDGTLDADVTIKYHQAAAGAGTSVPIAFTLSVPADSTMIVIGKDSPIYLEENRSLTAQASAANRIGIICSYEDITG